MGHGLYPLRWRAPGQTCPHAIQRQHGPQYSIQDSINHTWVTYIHLLYMILSIHLLYFGTIYLYPYIVLRYFLTIYCTLILSNPRSYHFLELGSYKILFNFSVNIASTISSPGTCGTVKPPSSTACLSTIYPSIILGYHI